MFTGVWRTVPDLRPTCSTIPKPGSRAATGPSTRLVTRRLKRARRLGSGIDDGFWLAHVGLDVDPRAWRNGAHPYLARVDRVDQLGDGQAGLELELGRDQQLVRAEVLRQHVDDLTDALRPGERGLDPVLQLGLGGLAEQQAAHLDRQHGADRQEQDADAQR